MSKFWGLVLENGRRYMQKVEAGFCISMAVLEATTDDKAIKLYVERDKAEFLLCSLTPKSSQLPLRIKFGRGETVALYFQGGSPSTRLHLSGYSFSSDHNSPFKGQQQSILVSEPKSADKNKDKKRVSIKESPQAVAAAQSESSSDDDDMDEGILSLTNGLDSDSVDSEKEEGIKLAMLSAGTIEADSDSDDDDDDDEDDDDDSLENDDDSDEISDSEVQLLLKKQKDSEPSSTIKSPEKRKGEPPSVMKTPENQNLKLKQPSSAGHTPMKQFSKGGVLCQELKIGSGTPAKQGRMVSVYYVGKLKNSNKKFDATESGPPFKFRLGKGEVIKGWDLGVDGMKIGGKRRLTVPANLAYGKKGAPPDIPPNSTLVFDVELKNVS